MEGVLKEKLALEKSNKELTKQLTAKVNDTKMGLRKEPNESHRRKEEDL